MPTATLWCPAYALPSAAAALRAREGMDALARATGLDWVAGPSCEYLGSPSTWPDAPRRQAEIASLWSSDVLIAARGGYGCIHLADQILELPGPAPGLIGYSDLTVLHALWHRRGWGETIYGFMPATPCGQRSLTSTAALIRGEGQDLGPDSVPGPTSIRPGQALGTCFAACVRVLSGLCGTDLQPDLTGCILALEDVDERVYRLDRDLEQLHRSGTLAGIRGLVFGTLTATEPAGYAGPDRLALVRTWAERLAVPCLFGLPFGHEQDPISLANGRETRLTVGTDGSWSLVQARLPAPPWPRRS